MKKETIQKQYYNVNFQIGDFWHSNLAYSSSKAAVEERYNKKYGMNGEVYVSEATEGDVYEAKIKEKPIVEI